MWKIGRILLARIGRSSGTAPPPEPSSNLRPKLVENRPRSDYQSNRHATDPFPDPSLLYISDSSQADDVGNCIELMLQDALIHGFPKAHVPTLRKSIEDRRNVFRTTFSAGPPANVPPLSIRLKPEAVPTVVKLRRYAPSQLLFLRNLMHKLLECNYIYHNPTAQWGSAPQLVVKPGPYEWRFTGDLRSFNICTIPMHVPMPVVEQELEKALGENVFGEFNMNHSYCQFLFHQKDQETQTLVFPDNLVTQKRLLHGHVKSNTHLQNSFTHKLSDDLKSWLLLWVDDMVVPGKSIPQYLSYLTSPLDLCFRLNIKPHPQECHLYLHSIIRCCHELSASGIRYSPGTLETLENMAPPRNPCELLQFTAAMQWIRQSIPDFTVLIRPLIDALERAYTITAKLIEQSL